MDKWTLIENLKRAYQYEEYQHAVRFSNAIDIYKKDWTVFNLKEKKYRKFTCIKSMEAYCLEMLRKYPFEPKKVTLKDFRNRILPAVKNSIDSFKPEDYHWNENINKTSTEHMYFLFHNGFVKIGKSKNVENRLKQLQTSLSNGYICYVFENKGFLEHTMHKVFSDFRQSGEWFTKDIRMMQFVTNRFKEKMCCLYADTTTYGVK